MSWAGSSGDGTDPLPPPPAEQEEDDAMPPLVTGEEAEALYLNQEDVLEEYDISDDHPPMDDDDDEDDELQLPPGVSMVVETLDGEEEEEAEGEVPDVACETFSGHTGPVYAVAINPKDPTMMLTGGGDDRGFLFTATALPRPAGQAAPAPPTEALVKELDDHGDSVNAVGFSSDGTMAATGAYNGKLMIWDTRSKTLVRTLEGPEDVEWLDWHSKGNILLAGSKDGTIWMWLASTGDCIKVFTGHEGEVTCGLFTADGKNICTGSTDGTVRVWGPKTGLCKHVFNGHGFHDGPITAIASHHEGALLLSGGVDGTARLVHVVNKRILATLVHTDPTAVGSRTEGDMEVTDSETSSVEAVGFSKVFNWCATGGMDGNLKIWDLANYTCRHVCQHEGGIVRLKWHDWLPLVYTACTDGVVRLWDARSGQCLYQLTGHQDMVLDLAVFCRPAAEGGDVVLTGGDDGKAKVFSVSLE